MQKSMKRLLSVLAVLALVLTMAPAGILAVETKADEIQSNLPAGVAATMAEGQAKQTALVEALDSLTGATAADRLEELKVAMPVCPLCGQSSSNLQLANSTTNYGSTAAQPQHHFVSGEMTKTGWESWNMSVAGAKACIILDKDSTISINGRLNLNLANTKINIGGLGKISSNMSATTYDGVAGMISLIGAGAELNLYGGKIEMTGTPLSGTTLKGFFRPIIYLANATATVNMWTDDVVIGPEEQGTTPRCNVRPYAGTFNMYGGTIQNAYSSNAGQAWNVMMQSTGIFNMYGGNIKDGKGSTGAGGNVILYNAGNAFNMYGGTISGGQGKLGGNIYVKDGGSVKLNGLIENGIAAEQGGNIYVAGSGTLELGNVDIKNGLVTPGTATLGNNIRMATGTLKLTGNAKVPSGILMTAADTLSVAPTFTGDVYVWNTASAVTMGASVSNGAATGAFTGVVKNGNWLYTPAANGQDAVYIPVAMEWDGATGLKYASCGVVYNGAITPAANSQAAVDAYVAAMADEEVEEKPQYVYVTEDVELKDGAEVAIWAANDITVSGKGVVLGVDRKNDNYAEHGAAITVADQVTVAKEVTAGGRHFIALEDASAADKYTFHRLEAALTNVTVNKDNAGMYYKAQYKFDAKVAEQVASYGVLVKLGEGVNAENYANKTTATDAATAYDAESATLTAKSHGVYGIFKTTNEAAVNVANGNTKLSGNPYIMIGDQMYTAAESTDMSLADAMVRANTIWEKLSEEAQANLNAFVSEWKALDAWSEDVLELLDNFTIA